MTIESINPLLGAFKPIKSIEQGANSIKPGNGGQEGGGFSEVLHDAIKEVNDLQATANNKIEGVFLNKNVSPHEAMLALEKADVAFQLMNEIRAKVVRAYEEVIRTQV